MSGGGRDRDGGGGDWASGSEMGANPPSATLYLGNLYFEVTETTLKQEFSKFGSVENAKIIYDSRGLSKG